MRDEEGNELINFDARQIAPIHGGFLIEKGYGRHPVAGVTWYGAKAYCEWRGRKEKALFRLPTEEEWEKAARGCCGRKYPWGNEFEPKRCNTYESGISDTTMIGSYHGGESPYRCSDMAGNVFEWPSSYYYEVPRSMFLRGGSWSKDRDYARCAFRSWGDPEFWNSNTGFRCVRTL